MSQSPPRDSNSDCTGSEPAASAVGLGGGVRAARFELALPTLSTLPLCQLGYARRMLFFRRASGSRTQPFRLSGEKGLPDRHARSAPMESNHPRPLIRRPARPVPGADTAVSGADTRRGVRRGIEPLCPGHSRPCLPKLPHGRSPGNRTQRVLVPSQAAHLAPRLRWRKALESNQSAVNATRLAVERRDHPDYAFHDFFRSCGRAQAEVEPAPPFGLSF